jgi:hypothetical protein
METIFEKSWLVTVPLIVVSGLVGTALMTFYMYLMTFLTQRVLKVTKILGTMITFSTYDQGELSDKQFSIVSGILMHYLIGILFMVGYFFLWKSGFGRPDFLTGLLFGFLSGILAIICWYSFFALHPNPPDVPLRSYLFTIFLAHFVFVFGCFITFVMLVKWEGIPY